MMLSLEQVVDEAHVRAFVKLCADDTLFEAGSKTAGVTARKQKSNLQAVADRPEAQRICDAVKTGLNDNALFRRFAVPQRFGRTLLSRYQSGMAYGAHFDDAFIDGVRTDLSFTVFLSAPDAYGGGELELISPMGSQAVKLPAGCALIYPSDQLHAVRPVTSGERLAVVGWVQSRIVSTELRGQLFELGQAISELEDSGRNESALIRLKMVRNNLLRAWSS